MRKRIGTVFSVGAVLLVGGIFWVLARHMIEQGRRTAIEHAVEMIPGVAQHIRDFRRVKMDDGRKLWEVSASDARYFDGEDLIVVTGPAVKWTRKDGSVVSLRGQEGRIRLTSHEVAEVEVKGAIEVEVAGYRIATGDARYDHESGRIVSPGRAKIEGDHIHLEGELLEVDVRGETLRLGRQVAMRFDPAKSIQE